jgi:hypothetical protein
VGVGLAAGAAGAGAADVHRLRAPVMGEDMMMNSTMMGSDGNGTMMMDDPPLATTMPNPDIIQPLPVMPANTTDEGDEEDEEDEDGSGSPSIISDSTGDDGSRQVTVAVPGGGILDLTLTESTITIPGFPAITVPGFGGFPSFRFPGTADIQVPVVEVVGARVEEADP